MGPGSDPGSSPTHATVDKVEATTGPSGTEYDVKLNRPDGSEIEVTVLGRTGQVVAASQQDAPDAQQQDAPDAQQQDAPTPSRRRPPRTRFPPRPYPHSWQDNQPLKSELPKRSYP